VGDFFISTELPGDRHDVGTNGSLTLPATLFALFVREKNETELVLPFGI
jgi:hypothetical protein